MNLWLESSYRANFLSEFARFHCSQNVLRGFEMFVNFVSLNAGKIGKLFTNAFSPIITNT
jgi:hypothetical protein